MSGHSHWSGIKHRKGINDAKRAGIFTKLGRLISVAAREGGGKLDMNFRLKMIVDKAKGMNMPKEKIERAIKNGTGELKDGAEIEEIIYEGYGPGQIAMLIKTMTDNRNRTVGELKNTLTKAGGKLVPAGSVSFLFHQVGAVTIDINGKAVDELELLAIDAGADDFIQSGETVIIYTKMDNLQKMKEAFDGTGVVIESADIIYIPIQKSTMPPESKGSYENLLEQLDDLSDVQEVFDNL